jgi:hypothetical protein
MENARKGYAPWKDAKAFNYIKLETDAERLEREKSEAEAKAAVMGAEKKLEDVLKTTDLKAWCLRHPIECEGDHDLYKNDICKNNADRIAKGDTITYKDKFEDNKERKLTKDDCMKLSASAEILAAKQKQEAARKAAAEAAIAAALEKLKTENPAEWCGKVGAAECNAAAEESKIAACKKCESENYEVYLAGKCEWTNPYVADASHVTLGLEYCRRHVEGLTSKDIYEQNKKEDEEKKAKEETETTVEDLKYKYTTTISLNFGTDDECDYQLLNWLENNIEKEKKCIFDQSIIKCDIMGDYQYTDKKGKSKDEPLITIGGETAVFERVTANEMFDANKDKKDSACDGKIFNDQEIGFCDIYGKNCRELTIDG